MATHASFFVLSRRQLHLEAAQHIFGLRQEALDPECRDYTCDLHGLHIDEALSALSRKLVDCYVAGHRVCYVVTGVGTGGHHVGGVAGKSRLRPAVKKWLDDNLMEYQETGVGEGNQGTFVVDLASGANT